MQEVPPHHVETLFHASRSRRPGPERQAYLDGACGGDTDLRMRVEALLEADEEASGFLEDPALTGPREGPGSIIGPYKLLQQIGEGGMGVVYMAEQEAPVRRKVALKVIKLGMDTKQVIARFEAERQALALMNHAHIARVLDAGATEAGRPYFVMELVRGVPIHEYCDTQKLGTPERLALFVDVCRAVQHAHQKGIIHRDLKPTNVLVTSHDGRPVPKIIDFGVAKATNQRLTERTLFTEYHQVIGTPEYMSPEQAEMSGLDVDTRSDIYALGVLLYQLLTGTTPVDPTELRGAAYEEMTRMIREDEAQAPSTRISKLGAAGERIAQHQSNDAGSLSRHFRGDLDWIVLKALEKDRTRRYETASAFAEDVLRHLGNLPVIAGPPGASYRLHKFVRRNQKAVLAALLLLLAIALGLAGTIAGFLRARDEARRSGEISDSLQHVLAMSDPTRAADKAELEKVLSTVRTVFGAEHATYAAVLDTLAQRLHDAGDFQAAAKLSRESLAVWREVYGEGHQNVAIALARLGSILRASGDTEQAERVLREALEAFDGVPTAPGLAGYTARYELADLLSIRGEYDEADVLLGELLSILRASPSPAPFQIIATLERRVSLRFNHPSGDARSALKELYEAALGFYEDDNPALAFWATGYGRELLKHGEQDAAITYLREGIRRFRASPKPQGISLFTATDTLFQALRNREDPESVAEADELLGVLVQLGEPYLDVENMAFTRVYYAKRMVELGRFAEALEATLDAHQGLIDAGYSIDQRENLRDNLTMMAFHSAIRADQDAEVYDLACQAAEEALRDEPGHPAMTVALGVALYRRGEYALALETLEGLHPSLDRAPGALARKMVPADQAFRAMTHARLGDLDRARSELEELRRFLAARNSDGGELGRAIVSEAEALLEHAPADD